MKVLLKDRKFASEQESFPGAAAQDGPITVLLEMRPALDGHAGIPQEVRLLFRGLTRIPELSVHGLLQASGHVLSRGLPARAGGPGGLPRHRAVNRLSRVVISLQHQLHSVKWHTIAMAVTTLCGRLQALGRFDASLFRDFIWRHLFARTLVPSDLEEVTSAQFRVVRVPWVAMHRCALAFRRFGMSLYPQIDSRDYDIMIAETPYPGRVLPRTRLIIRYHDAIPMLMPHTISDKPYHQASHYQALRLNVDEGAWFACVSEATRRDLVSIFPQVEPRTATIHNMISDHYFDAEVDMRHVEEILRTRSSQFDARQLVTTDTEGAVAEGGAARPATFILIVSTIEPRKNHLTLLSAWEQLHATDFPDLRLVVVGMRGWDSEPILAKLMPWVKRGRIHLLEDVPATELRALYKTAQATICPSLYEGFDFSGVEAMRCGGAVVASDIPVHREIFDDGAEYFSMYSAVDLASAITRVVAADAYARRAELVQRGADVARRYLPERIIPLWREFLMNQAKLQKAMR